VTPTAHLGQAQDGTKRRCLGERPSGSGRNCLTLRAVHCLDVSTSRTLGSQYEQTASGSIRSAGTPLPTFRTSPYVVPTFSRTGESIQDSSAPCPEFVGTDPATADVSTALTTGPALSLVHIGPSTVKAVRRRTPGSLGDHLLTSPPTTMIRPQKLSGIGSKSSESPRCNPRRYPAPVHDVGRRRRGLIRNSAPRPFVSPEPSTQHSGPWSLGNPAPPTYLDLMQTHTLTQPLDDEAIGGPIIGAEHHRVMAYPRDRVCEHPGCSTRLSMYNHDPLCAVHDHRGVPLCVHVARTTSRRAARSSHRRAA